MIHLESHQKPSNLKKRKQEPLNAKEKNHKLVVPYDQDSDLLSEVTTEENSSPASELASGESSIDHNEDSLSSSTSIFEQQDWKAQLSSEKIKRSQDTMASCDVCQKQMYRRDLQRHKRDVHEKFASDICVSRHHTAALVDIKNGIFLVSRNIRSCQSPVHVQKQLSGPNVAIQCELLQCEDARRISAINGQLAYECEHLRSTMFAQPLINQPSLRDEILIAMQDKYKIISNKMSKECSDLKTLAINQDVNLLGMMSPKEHTSQRFKYFSVLTNNTHSWAPLGRVVVSVDTQDYKLVCKCSGSRRSCVHKCIVKWYLMQEESNYPISTQTDTEEDDDMVIDGFHENARDNETQFLNNEELQSSQLIVTNADEILYPPTGEILNNLVDYLFHEKSITSEKIDISTVKKHLHPVTLYPKEKVCFKCGHTLGKPVLISKSAKLYNMDGVIENCKTFLKFCKNCSQVTRYQEYEDGIVNYDDHTLLSLHLCVHIRYSVQNHVAPGRVMNSLNMYLKGKKMEHKLFLNGYLLFEALTKREYNFFCNICGYFPTILTFDLNKKTVFDISIGDIEELARKRDS